MGLHNLQPAAGSINRDGKRLGRGQGSGKGGTAARGHKGAKSRSGYSTVSYTHLTLPTILRVQISMDSALFQKKKQKDTMHLVQLRQLNQDHVVSQ